MVAAISAVAIGLVFLLPLVEASSGADTVYLSPMLGPAAAGMWAWLLAYLIGCRLLRNGKMPQEWFQLPWFGVIAFSFGLCGIVVGNFVQDRVASYGYIDSHRARRMEATRIEMPFTVEDALDGITVIDPSPAPDFSKIPTWGENNGECCPMERIR